MLNIKDNLVVYEKTLDEKFKVSSAEDIFGNIKSINIDYKQENFLIFFLDVKNRVINQEVVFKGAMDCCILDPKVVFRKALVNNASKIIIAHNHPSGELTPSPEDLEITEKMVSLGKDLDLRVLDHVIFSEKFYKSLQEEDLI
jgi:DNA repair protein RadC